MAQAFGEMDSLGEPQLHDPSDIRTRPNSMLDLLAVADPAASLRWMDTTGQDVFSTTLGDLDTDELQVYVCCCMAVAYCMCKGRGTLSCDAGGCSGWRSCSRTWNAGILCHLPALRQLPQLFDKGVGWHRLRLGGWMLGHGMGTWRLMRTLTLKWMRCCWRRSAHGECTLLVGTHHTGRINKVSHVS